MSLEKKSKNQVLILAIYMLMIATWKEAFWNIEIDENGKNDKNKDENLGTNIV